MKELEEAIRRHREAQHNKLSMGMVAIAGAAVLTFVGGASQLASNPFQQSIYLSAAGGSFISLMLAFMGLAIGVLPAGFGEMGVKRAKKTGRKKNIYFSLAQWPWGGVRYAVILLSFIVVFGEGLAAMKAMFFSYSCLPTTGYDLVLPIDAIGSRFLPSPMCPSGYVRQKP